MAVAVVVGLVVDSKGVGMIYSAAETRKLYEKGVCKPHPAQQKHDLRVQVAEQVQREYDAMSVEDRRLLVGALASELGKVYTKQQLKDWLAHLQDSVR